MAAIKTEVTEGDHTLGQSRRSKQIKVALLWPFYAPDASTLIVLSAGTATKLCPDKRACSGSLQQETKQYFGSATTTVDIGSTANGQAPGPRLQAPGLRPQACSLLGAATACLPGAS